MTPTQPGIGDDELVKMAVVASNILRNLGYSGSARTVDGLAAEITRLQAVVAEREEALRSAKRVMYGQLTIAADRAHPDLGKTIDSIEKLLTAESRHDR